MVAAPGEMQEAARVERDRIDIVKGILMLAVIVGHNEAITYFSPSLRQCLYYFHVQCFFLLSSLLDTKPLSRKLVADRAVRYLVPFVLFMLLSWIAYHVVTRNITGMPHSVPRLARALFTGGEVAIHDAVGMRYLWFLPALFSLVMLKASACRGGLAAGALRAIAMLWLGTAALVPAGVRDWMPLGSAAGLFFFGLGELFRSAVTRAGARLDSWRVGLCCTVAAAVIAVGIVTVPLGRIAAAGIANYDIRFPLTWSAGLIFPCLVLPGLLWLARSLPLSGIGVIGKYSLQIYLVHMFVYRLLTRLRFGADYDDLAIVGADLAAGLAILTLTLGISLVIAMGTSRLPRLQSLVFPRDWAEWRGAIGWPAE